MFLLTIDKFIYKCNILNISPHGFITNMSMALIELTEEITPALD